MFFRLDPSSGIPVYLQLVAQVRHAVETGALGGGDQLPTIRALARDLVINANTVARAYRELEHEGVIDLKQGLGAFIAASAEDRSGAMRKGQRVVENALEQLDDLGLTRDEVRRLVDGELARIPVGKGGKR